MQLNSNTPVASTGAVTSVMSIYRNRILKPSFVDKNNLVNNLLKNLLLF